MSSKAISAVVPEHLLGVPAYEPGKPVEELEREFGIVKPIKVASNENPLGPSPLATVAAREAVPHANLYPEGGCYYLRTAVAERLHVDPAELIFGAGSNELISVLVTALCRPGLDEVVAHKYAFISYRLTAIARNVPFVETKVTSALGCDVDDLIAHFSDRTRIVFLANPNNPTGSYVDHAALERILGALPSSAVLVVDEAYHEYASRFATDYPNALDYRKQQSRLICLRTFSKVYGLAGMRVGYGIGDRELVSVLNRVRRPFNVNSIAQAAALAALSDQEHVEASCALAKQSIVALDVGLSALGLQVYPSLGNFVLVDLKRDDADVYQKLLPLGVIVRPMRAWGLPQHVRISVGTQAQTQAVVAAMAKVLG